MQRELLWKICIACLQETKFWVPCQCVDLSVAIGAILGACVGDAAGAPLENLHCLPSRDQVLGAMSMSGGGAHRTAPGQVTDDGEQTISQARGLVACGKNFDVNLLAEAYVEWLNSMPFDAGMTTFETIGAGSRMSKTSHGKAYLKEVGYA
eukprot:TRINITY_DN8364_c0_g1_i1.p1 TRINITY_DN8364_c0_g1~~TRINITY_DN8364_c0_g1_i1.p1  ORF type:complete len:151 (-),score=30.16 TRINITY_DN8364_c0_g1_i1:736-1188(-)